MRKDRTPTQARWPWDPVELDLNEVRALKSLTESQLSALAKLGGEHNPFTPGGEDGRRATDFALGKLWVIQTVHLARAAKMPSPG